MRKNNINITPSQEAFATALELAKEKMTIEESTRTLEEINALRNDILAQACNMDTANALASLLQSTFAVSSKVHSLYRIEPTRLNQQLLFGIAQGVYTLQHNGIDAFIQWYGSTDTNTLLLDLINAGYEAIVNEPWYIDIYQEYEKTYLVRGKQVTKTVNRAKLVYKAVNNIITAERKKPTQANYYYTDINGTEKRISVYHTTDNNADFTAVKNLSCDIEYGDIDIYSKTAFRCANIICSRLSLKHARIYYAYYIDACTIEQICGLYDIKKSTVYNALKEIKLTLKDIYKVSDRVPRHKNYITLEQANMLKGIDDYHANILNQCADSLIEYKLEK